jgi:hypothetical protein
MQRFSQSQIHPCAVCGHKDARDRSHQRGCPALPAVAPERLLAIARAVEAGWTQDEEQRERLAAMKGEAQRARQNAARPFEPSRNVREAVQAWRAGA